MVIFLTILLESISSLMTKFPRGIAHLALPVDVGRTNSTRNSTDQMAHKRLCRLGRFGLYFALTSDGRPIMPMNSFCFRAEQPGRYRYEREKSELLNLYPEASLLSKDGPQWEVPHGRRQTERCSVQLTVLVANHLRAFRTECQNLSCGGLLLKEVLPIEFSKTLFDIILIQQTSHRNKNYVLFRGAMVGTTMLSRRIQFQSMTLDARARLNKLLAPFAVSL